MQTQNNIFEGLWERIMLSKIDDLIVGGMWSKHVDLPKMMCFVGQRPCSTCSTWALRYFLMGLLRW